jgi:hypothetical protein
MPGILGMAAAWEGRVSHAHDTPQRTNASPFTQMEQTPGQENGGQPYE